MRTLQWHLKAHWSPESDPPSLPVPLPWEVRWDLSWWMVRDHLLTGVRFGTPAPDLHLYSDASCSGWGAHLLDQHVSGVWSDQEKLLHINLLEMKALFLGLQAFRVDVIGHHVTAMCDNSHGRGIRQQARGHGFPGSMLVGQPPSEMDREFRHPSRCEVSTRTSQCPGRCPQPSRASSRDRVVHPQVARSLLRVWGNPSIDLFATCLNAKLPLYCSLVPDPQAVFEDAFRHPWDDLDLYASLPFLWSSGDRPCPRVVAGCDDSGRTPLAREGVVRRLTASTDPTTSRPALVGQSAPAAPLQPLPPRRPLAEPSCVATLRRHFRKSGFSGRAAGVL